MGREATDGKLHRLVAIKGQIPFGRTLTSRWPFN